jgi:dolichyl-diphosphooligosaccharide--protein glycosyltransferase
MVDDITNKEELKKESTTDDELNIDFSAIKNKLAGWFKSETKLEHHDSHSEHKSSSKGGGDELSLDFVSITSFWKKHQKWLIPVACILIAMIISIYFRTMPQRMPITDDWAQNTVYNFYQNNIVTQINQQYPNLPQQNKNVLIEKEFAKFKEQNKAQMDNDIKQFSQQYKEQFKDENGTLYLLGIDPWHFYRQTYYILQNGYPGNELEGGVPWDSYRLAPTGVGGGWDFHVLAGATLYQIMNLFGSYPLMFTFFFIGTIFSALAVIPAFFIGRRITGNNVGGFFTALLIAVSSFFVQRTTGESSDTDVYVVFFPLLITWLFLEAFEAKELKKKLGWVAGAGAATGLFSFAWTGWWYVFDFILATVGVYIIYLLAKDYHKITETIKSKGFLDQIYFFGGYAILSGIFVSLFMGFSTFYNGFLGPLGFMQMKAVAVTSLWPNIMTTVAELNVAPMSQVIEMLGGKLLFALALVGVLLSFLKKDAEGKFDVKIPIFLTLWFIASLYATTRGVRFTLQATPVFAIAFGAFLGFTWHYASQWITKELKMEKHVTQIVIFILLGILLIQPIQAGYAQAYGSVSSMNDGWYNTLTKIKNEAPQNIIITSWWDFGYWFRAIADRPVTFDGGTQVGWGAHWVGRSLLTSDEEETAGIVMMLNCGQNSAFDELDKIFNDTPKEIAILHKILLEDKEGAIKVLNKEGLTPEQIATVIKYLHCDAPTDYYITSDDMVGKAGVWGHFGSWDFNKASMYQETKNLARDTAVQVLTNKWNLSSSQADQVYYDIQNTPADQYVAGWPSYISGLNACQEVGNNTLSCGVNTQQGTVLIQVELSNYTATVKTNDKGGVYPNSLVYADKEGVKEKKFTGNLIGFSAILIPLGNNYVMMLSDPTLANSVFTKLFFFDGHGMKCFKKFDEAKPFTGGKIVTWIVDYDCKQSNKLFFLPKEEVDAAHILIMVNEKRTDAEALQLAEEIKSNLTTANFADYAKKYSDDPGSAANGGGLGWFGKGMMVPEFEKAAFELKAGEISEPVKTQFGYHLIWVKEKRNES